MTISIKDIARKAKVSTATVSRVINHSPLVKKNTRNKVLKIIRKCRYNPNLTARSLIKGKSNLLTLIIPPYVSSVSPYQFKQIVCGINDALIHSDYRLLIIHPESYNEKNGYELHIQNVHTDAFFILSPIVGDRLVKQLENCKNSSVLIGGRSRHLDWVDLNHVQAVEKVIEYLHQLGHTKIALVLGNNKTVSLSHSLEGYRSALEKFGIPLNADWIVSGDGQFKGGYECAKTLLSMVDAPTAILAMNDFMAVGAVRAAADSGFLVPQDVSIFGFDDIDIAVLSHPPLSTVRQPFYEMGKAAAEILTERLRNENLPQKFVELDGKMILRESCANAKKTKEDLIKPA